MSFNVVSLAKSLFRRPVKKSPPTPESSNRFRPMVERLEEKVVPATVTVSALANATEGGSAGTFRYTRDGDISQSAQISVTYSAGSTATPGSDYSFLTSQVTFAANSATADATVSSVDDGTSEPTETVVATIVSGGSMTIGSPYFASINIFDNDAQVVSVAPEDAGEADNVGWFVFTRIGDLSGGLTANFSVTGGTATSGTDFTALGTTVTFTAGSSVAQMVVTALKDNLVDAEETIIGTVGSGSGYSVGSPSSATVYIIDDPAVIEVANLSKRDGS